MHGLDGQYISAPALMSTSSTCINITLDVQEMSLPKLCYISLSFICL